MLALALVAQLVSAAWHEEAPRAQTEGSSSVKFIIASTQRSGSTYLGELLNNSPNVIFYRELFMRDNFAILERARRLNTTVFRNSKEYPYDLWSEGLDLGLEQPCSEMKAVGFKWMMNQGLEANMDKAIQQLNEQSIRVVVLERTNFLRQAISEYAMETNNGPVHAHAGESTTKSNAVDVPAEYFMYYFRRHEQWSMGLRNLAEKTKFSMYIPYEEFVQDKQTYVTQLQEFLQLGDNASEILQGDHLQKLHEGSIDDLVTDWAQKREVLLQTEFADRVKLWEQDDTAAASKQSQMSSAISLIERGNSLQRIHRGGNEHLWLLERKCPEYKWK